MMMMMTITMLTKKTQRWLALENQCIDCQLQDKWRWLAFFLSIVGRAGGSARVAKVLAFASFGLQILESDMSYNVFTS